ncbi:MAG: heparinase II/III family protein [Planctomycetes bacterium]|nr:heparinase II/III family protein [Planctomycetota bacterium]
MNWTSIAKAVLPRRLWPWAKQLKERSQRRRDLAAAREAAAAQQTTAPTPIIASPEPAAAPAVPTPGTVAPPVSTPRLLRPDAPAPLNFFAVADRATLKSAWDALGPEARVALVREADDAVVHRFNLLGSGPCDLGETIDWQRDFKSGAAWELKPIAQVPTLHGLPGSDIKVPWELSRFYHAPVLGVAYLITQDDRYPRAFAEQVRHWIQTNPVAHGANWVCAMEAAIRAANWIIALNYLMPHPALDDAFLAELEQSLFQHGTHTRTHLEGTAKLRSNHYLADLQGLIYLGLLFRHTAEGQEWLAFSVRELEAEMQWEVYDDGTDFEASTGYHRLCLELIMSPAILCRGNGVTLSDAFWSRLHKMFTAIRDLLDTAGRIPLIGDNDSGRLHRMAVRDDDDLRYLLPLGAALFGDPSLKLPGVPFSEEALLHLGPRGLDIYNTMPASPPPAVSTAMRDSGWYVLRHGRSSVHVACGPNGQRYRNPDPSEPQSHGGHAHNDKLSITLSVGDRRVLVDPGQYCYTSDHALRNHSRSTASHNVVQIAGLEQQSLKSDYLFHQHDGRARPAVVKWQPNASDGPWFVGEHHGFAAGAGVVCRRSLAPLGADGFSVEDAFAVANGAQPGPFDATFHLHLAPGLDVEDLGDNRWSLGGLAAVEFPRDITFTAQTVEDFVAPEFGARRPARVLRLTAELRAPLTVRWTLVPSPTSSPVLSWTPKQSTESLNVLRYVESELRQLTDRSREEPRPARKRFGRVLYVRLDYWNSRAIGGGSLGHTAHVVQGLVELGLRVHAAAGFYFPMVDPALVATTVLPPPDPKTFSQDYELQYFEANRSMAAGFNEIAERFKPDFIYERFVIGNCLPVRTAHRLGIPYVLEYNGSELWVRRNWGKQAPLRNEALMLDVEQRIMRGADLITVVSEPLRQELIERGVDDRRILVNPNAVDPHEFDRHRLESDRIRIRASYGFQPNDIVLGFIGTFGAWHGVQVLADTMASLMAIDPRMKMLLIGDGNLGEVVKKRITETGLGGRIAVTGVVPQHQGPGYLSACDIYLSPHQVPPDDKRPFFGSPTKLFEYMAMEGPTIASDLGQIGQVLSPSLRVEEIAGADAASSEALGVLVKPGDGDELVRAVAAMVRHPDLGKRMALNARKRILERHTWQQHIQRILDRLAQVGGRAGDGERTRSSSAAGAHGH